MRCPYIRVLKIAQSVPIRAAAAHVACKSVHVIMSHSQGHVTVTVTVKVKVKVAVKLTVMVVNLI
jgi:hypothetical protein